MSVTGANKGFTLIDLLLVIMILGVLGMMAGPLFNSLITETKLNEAAGELVSGLQYAGNLAVQHQRPFGLMADVDGNWFRVFDYQYKDDPNPYHDNVPPVDAYGVVLNPIDKQWYIKDFDTIKNYAGIDIASAPAGGEIRFFPDGHSWSSDNTFVLNYGNRQRTVTVDGTTGRVNATE